MITDEFKLLLEKIDYTNKRIDELQKKVFYIVGGWSVLIGALTLLLEKLL